MVTLSSIACQDIIDLVTYEVNATLRNTVCSLRKPTKKQQKRLKKINKVWRTEHDNIQLFARQR